MTSDNHNSGNHLELLQQLRQSIDNIDAAIIYMLAERFKLTGKIGQLKATYKLPPVDNKRESEQTGRLRSLAQKACLNPDFSERIFRVIVTEVVNNHKSTMSSMSDITKE